MLSCPHYLTIAPAINETWRAWRHWSKGQLQLMYPGGVAMALLNAISDMDNGFIRGQNEAQRRAMAKAKAKGHTSDG